MSNNNINCPVCASNNFRFIFEKNEKLFYRCKNCSFEMQHPMPSTEELKYYYDNAYNEGLYKDFVDAIKMKRVNADYRYKHTKKYIEGNVLDVGCSDGHFLNKLAENKIDAEGIDISEIAVNYSVSKGLKAFTSDLESYVSNNKYKTIIGFDIIEHVRDPNQFLNSIKRLIQNDGTLILSTPNKKSIFQKLMGKYWYFYIPEEHLLYFDKSTLRILLEKHGFQIVDQKNFSKPLTLEYGLSQFEVYNPLIYKILSIITSIFPKSINTLPIPFYIGEMISISTYKGTSKQSL
jgi:2-polyprenyl-3-methyl-5-hydroxy-6-metoxy-1,4-benzoquinol methylase